MDGSLPERLVTSCGAVAMLHFHAQWQLDGARMFFFLFCWCCPAFLVGHSQEKGGYPGPASGFVQDVSILSVHTFQAKLRCVVHVSSSPGTATAAMGRRL